MNQNTYLHADAAGSAAQLDETVRLFALGGLDEDGKDRKSVV